MKKVIVFTGGHYNSGIEIAKYLKQKGCEIVWLGHKYNLGDNKSISAEYREVTVQDIKFLELKTGRFYKKFSLSQFFLILNGFIQSFYYLLKYRPSLIYSSGGFMSVPVVITGFFLGIPSVTHEQTVVAGWANKAIAPFVKKIFLTYVDKTAQYPAKKSIVVGIPLNDQLLNTKNTINSKEKILFITAGKQGSDKINQAVFPLIPNLVKEFKVIHQIGSNNNTNSQKNATAIKSSLGKLSNKYVFADYFFGKDQATYLRSADIVICRAGAHTVYEVISLNKKAIMIPISWVSHQEQVLNAKHASATVGSIVLNESELGPSSLNAKINEAKSKPAQKLPKIISNDAVEKVYFELEKMDLL